MDNRDQRIGNWERFIILEDNKASLAHFLSTEISESYSAPPGRELVINGGFKDTLKVWSSDTSRQDIRELASDHEEADTRIVLHARDVAARGYKQVNILCRDTDVLVLLLAHREQLCQEIWMFAGTSRQRRLHTSSQNPAFRGEEEVASGISCHYWLSLRAADAFPIFRRERSDDRKCVCGSQAITGCDTTSQFYSVGKA